jgi:hypothetical protein
MLLMIFRTEVPAGQQQDHRIDALKLTEPTPILGVISQLVVGKDRPGDDVGSHDLSLAS